MLFFLSCVIAITILEGVIVTVHADLIETHIPYSSNLFLNSVAFILFTLIFKIYGFSSKIVLILTSSYFNIAFLILLFKFLT